MKPIQKSTEVTNIITIKNKVYKFTTETYYLKEQKNYINVNCCNFIDKDTNKIIIETLLKSVKGELNNIKFNYSTLYKDLKFQKYLESPSNVKFINELSLKLNNKKYFNYEEDEVDSQRSNYLYNIDESNNNEIQTFHNNRKEENRHINVTELTKTCIISCYTKVENFKEIPIYHYYGNKNNSTTPIICEFSLLINILTKKLHLRCRTAKRCFLV